MFELIFIILLSSIPAAFSFLLDYCLGHPGADNVNTKSIFFKYTLALSRRRVKQAKGESWKEFKQSFFVEVDDLEARVGMTDQFEQTVVLIGRKFFTWERAVGMCVYCTNVYFATIAAGLFFFFIPTAFFHPGLYFIFIPVFSHLILRKI